jgi:hypothetical protein
MDSEITEKYENFRLAQKRSIELLISPNRNFLDSMVEKTIKFDQTMIGHICGFITTGKKDYRTMRLDYDPNNSEKGCHINVSTINGQKYALKWGSMLNYEYYRNIVLKKIFLILNIVGVFDARVKREGLRLTIEKWLAGEDFMKL